ncbi:MAG: metalloregulator ArsR/SmtB family transcription factor [Anaerolineae bacterium]|nr:metalloregulator ArsR/SmtB family transcription factor [Anaerolineae bacterium]NUQ04050.1 winged helix-turn-helix transcriptional regulator [Anaerolineae bacterium]
MHDSNSAGDSGQMTDVKRKKKSEVMTLGDARLIARYFQALSDPTRVRMIRALADQEWSVSDLTVALGMDQPAVSHQLKYLREMELVKWTKVGRHVYYTLADPHLIKILLSSIARFQIDGAEPPVSPVRKAKV